MAKRPVITEQMAKDAAAEGARQYAPGYVPVKGDTVRMRAVDVILRHYATQERYALDVQTPAEYAKATRLPTSRAAELERLTEDGLLELQAKLTSDYPGKAS